MITWVIEIYEYDSVYMIVNMNRYDRDDVIVMNYMKEGQYDKIDMNEKKEYEMCYMIENRMSWLHLRREEMN